MDFVKRKRGNIYDRVMPRVYSGSRTSLKSNSSLVTRHDIPSARIGAKPSVSNSPGVLNELPTVLNDYIPDSCSEKRVKRSYVVKPRKTLKSMRPTLSSSRLVLKNTETSEKPKFNNIRARCSAPSILDRDTNEWSDCHVKQCYSSRSHTRLKELKNEIKAYHETEKLLKLKDHLYKSCGVVLNDTGQLAEDKAVQAASVEPDKAEQFHARSEQHDGGWNARTSVPYQQMRSDTFHYPVDRYLVESSKNIEMVNIIDDEIWNPEPALRPEDEIMLRKLHEMLQSTADDLKQLSGELSRFHEPGVQVKTLPTPLDEEFNERVHIEEIVNAKFHGYNIIKNSPLSESIIKSQKTLVDKLQSVPNNLNKPEVIDTSTQVNGVPNLKKSSTNKKLQISRTKTVQINGTQCEKSTKNKNENDSKVCKSKPTIVYNEFSHEYNQPIIKEKSFKPLQIQDMPRINIRSELREQKVLHMDIMPDSNVRDSTCGKTNVAVIAVQHETTRKTQVSDEKQVKESEQLPRQVQHTIRKISRMSTYESSESTNNISFDGHYNLKSKNQVAVRHIPKNVLSNEHKKGKNIVTNRKELGKRIQFNIEEWKRKLHGAYGQSSTSKKTPKRKEKNVSSKKCNIETHRNNKSEANVLNNAEYIPYSQLTLGGVRVSDIEREITNIPNKNDIPLSPILDRILKSRENSFHNDSPKNKNILTTSDENLLQEVIDIERTVSETLSKNQTNKEADETSENQHSDESVNDNVSYVDDFEDEKSDDSLHPERFTEINVSSKSDKSNGTSKNSDDCEIPDTSKTNDHNVTYTKTPNLSFKNTVDIFEFVHSVDTQDMGTQSNITQKISLKETQTSPRNDRPNIQPIHNDLWPSIDPKGEVEKMFKLEKDFIKKLIIDEYGDLLEKDITKPSTSKDAEKKDRNVAASQKNTQTSPAHIKSVMTSPTRTKTRTTSPFALSLTVDHHTSPMSVNNEEVKVTIENEGEDVDISINLKSPRFSLRLPQTSREVLSNLEVCSHTSAKSDPKRDSKIKEIFSAKRTVSSSSSLDADKSSSDMSSLGEVKFKLKRQMTKSRHCSLSESSVSSTYSKYSSDFQSNDILPLRSEGEINIKTKNECRSNKQGKSDGEMSFGR